MALLLLASASPVGAAPVQATTPAPFSTLSAAHGHSVPGPIAVSPNGNTAFVAEAGVLKVVATSNPSSWTDLGNLHPISSHHVRAVELALDPEADLDQPDGPEDLLYVAGGRLGLWVMQADPTFAFPVMEPRAARVDDADSQSDLQLQSSARWCNDVDFMTLEGTTYLVALFAAKNDSRLRLYELSRVRAVLNAHLGQETGNEIWPDQELILASNPANPAPPGTSYAFGLAVDGQRVYVALGQHGLVRVTFCHSFCTPGVSAGPWFGKDSHYEATITTGPYEDLYGDFEYLVTDSTQNPPDLELHRHAPYFMDVAVERDGPRTYLWSAVDHIGLVRFRVTSPSAWSPSMPIDHQEGEMFTNPDDEEQIRLVDTSVEPGMVTGYAHRLSLFERDGKRVLAAAVLEQPYFNSDGLLDEGQVLDHLATRTQWVIAPYPLEGPNVMGAKPYTLLYDLTTLGRNPPAAQTPPPGAQPYNHTVVLSDTGGRQVVLAQEPAASEVLVLGAKRVSDPIPPDGQTTFMAVYDWTQQPPVQTGWYDRRAEDRPGRHGSAIGYLRSNARVLLTGSNDSGLAADGTLVTCADSIRRFYTPPGGDPQSTFGVTPDEFAVWPHPTAGHDFVGGSARTWPDPTNLPPDPGRKRWMLVEFDGGTNVCSTPTPDPPNRVKRMYVETPPDRFGEEGRGNYIGLSVPQEYNSFLATLGLQTGSIAIGTRDRSDLGYVVLDLGRLESSFPLVADGAIYDPTTGATPAYRDDLVTHPEFANVPANSSTAGFMAAKDLSSVLSHFPVFHQIPSHDENGSADHWVLCGGAGTIFFPQGLRDQVDPTWHPDAVYQTWDQHSMVRIFDMQDPTPALDVDPTTSPPTHTLIGPDPQSHAFRLHAFEISDRDYLAVADLGGYVQIWDLTDLLDTATPPIITPNLASYGDFLVERWVTPLCLSDDEPNAVWSLDAERVHVEGQPTRAVERLYVMVARVGVRILEFDPTLAPGARLVEVGGIQTPSGSGGLHIRDDAETGLTDLLVLERDSGVRIFKR